VEESSSLASKANVGVYEVRIVGSNLEILANSIFFKRDPYGYGVKIGHENFQNWQSNPSILRLYFIRKNLILAFAKPKPNIKTNNRFVNRIPMKS